MSTTDGTQQCRQGAAMDTAVVDPNPTERRDILRRGLAAAGGGTIVFGVPCIESFGFVPTLGAAGTNVSGCQQPTCVDVLSDTYVISISRPDFGVDLQSAVFDITYDPATCTAVLSFDGDPGQPGGFFGDISTILTVVGVDFPVVGSINAQTGGSVTIPVCETCPTDPGEPGGNYPIVVITNFSFEGSTVTVEKAASLSLCCPCTD